MESLKITVLFLRVSKTILFGFLLRVVLFLFFLILGVGILEWRLRTNDPTHSSAQYAAAKNPRILADTIILGSSTAVYGYVPKAFHSLSSRGCDFQSTYNFALYGAQPPYFNQWYKHVFRPHHPSPALAIISIDWFSAGAARDQTQDQLGAYRLAQDAKYLPFKTLLKLFWTLDNKGRKILILNSLRLIGSSTDLRYLLSPRVPLQTTGYDQGYLPLDAHIENVKGGWNRAFSVTPEYIQALRSLITALQQDNAEIILIQFPTYKPDNIKNIEGLVLYQELADSFSIHYINYNKQPYVDLNENPKLYADWSHLNSTGAQIFDRKVVSDIRTLLDKGVICAQ